MRFLPNPGIGFPIKTHDLHMKLLFCLQSAVNYQKRQLPPLILFIFAFLRNFYSLAVGRVVLEDRFSDCDPAYKIGYYLCFGNIKLYKGELDIEMHAKSLHLTSKCIDLNENSNLPLSSIGTSAKLGVGQSK